MTESGDWLVSPFCDCPMVWYGWSLDTSQVFIPCLHRCNRIITTLFLTQAVSFWERGSVRLMKIVACGSSVVAHSPYEKAAASTVTDFFPKSWLKVLGLRCFSGNHKTNYILDYLWYPILIANLTGLRMSSLVKHTAGCVLDGFQRWFHHEVSVRFVIQ